MACTLITLVKLSTVHLFVDTKNKIITVDIFDSNYCEENFITFLEYFKNFWILAKEQNVIYNLIIKLDNISFYSLNFYNYLVKYLIELNDIFKTNLHACAFLCNINNISTILNPLFSMYKFNKPLTICNTYEDVLIFFNKK